MRPVSLVAYGLALQALEPLAPWLLKTRARRGKEDPERLRERLGYAAQPRPSGPLVWLHGASLGESLSLLPLAEGLLQRRPELNLLFTSGTVAAAELMARRKPAAAIHQFAPLDIPAAAERFMGHWRPDLAVFVESELWPTLLAAAKRRGARLALVSARLSAASVEGWRRTPDAARTVLSGFDLVMAQDATCAERLTGLGARDDGRLNLKLAGRALPVDPAARAAMIQTLEGRPLLAAVSTHPGEDEMALSAFAPLLQHPTRPLLLIAPRHPVRGPAVASLASSRGLSTVRRGGGGALKSETRVLVADTLGELGLWFSLARCALVAGSLVPGIGGHNPVEPARMGCPVLSGPYVDNWSSVYEALDAVDGFAPVTDAASLSEAWRNALADPSPGMDAMAARARQLAERQDTALDAALDQLAALLETAS